MERLFNYLFEQSNVQADPWVLKTRKGRVCFWLVKALYGGRYQEKSQLISLVRRYSDARQRIVELDKKVQLLYDMANGVSRSDPLTRSQIDKIQMDSYALPADAPEVLDMPDDEYLKVKGLHAIC